MPQRRIHARRCSAVTTLIGLLALGLPAQAVTNSSIPPWLQKAEVYNGYYAAWDDKHMARMRGIPFVIGVLPDKAIIDKAHKAGARVLTYATFYQGPPNEVYQRANIAEHPDWPMILPDGSEALSVFAGATGSDYRPGWRAVCRNSPGYWDYAMEHTRFLMKLGVDGIFVDNVFDDQIVCHGPELGRHTHKFPGKTNPEVYHEFLKALRAEMRRFGSDKILVANTTGAHPEWTDVCDAMMLESYICTWAENRRWQDEARILELCREWAPVVDSGCRVLALSYLGYTPNPRREDAFYCYAWARLSGFMWADWFTGGSAAADLFRAKLGRPTSSVRVGGGCYTREFERGIVVVTPSPPEKGVSATVVTLRTKCSRLYDVFAGKNIKPDASGAYKIELAAGKGRVFLFPRAIHEGKPGRRM